MNKKEYEEVINQEPQIRYEYFIKKVCDTDAVWVLYKDSCATLIDSEGNTRIPFFPLKEFAETCAIGTEFRAESIDLDHFMNDWVKQMKRDGIKPAIFPNDKNMTILNVDILLKDLENELENY